MICPDRVDRREKPRLHLRRPSESGVAGGDGRGEVGIRDVHLRFEVVEGPILEAAPPCLVGRQLAAPGGASFNLAGSDICGERI